MDAFSRFGHRRAWVLGLVQLVLGAHVLWWVATGEAVAPLEPSEGMAFARDGEVNPGLVLFLLAGLATLVFGRFFCGWACHLLALQDGARWVLMKLGIRPRPFRSRLLRLVPLALYDENADFAQYDADRAVGAHYRDKGHCWDWRALGRALFHRHL